MIQRWFLLPHKATLRLFAARQPVIYRSTGADRYLCRKSRSSASQQLNYGNANRRVIFPTAPATICWARRIGRPLRGMFIYCALDRDHTSPGMIPFRSAAIWMATLGLRYRTASRTRCSIWANRISLPLHQRSARGASQQGIDQVHPGKYASLPHPSI